MSRTFLSGWVFFVLVLGAFGQAPVNVIGVVDRTVYNNSVSFSVPSIPSHSYFVTLNGNRLATDMTNAVTAADFYELSVWRTNMSTAEITNRVVRFIVQSSRGDSERGLIEWLPYPSIPSTSNEFAGAQLRLIMPQQFPQGFPIPVVAWVDDADGNQRRANGFVTAPGFAATPIKILRGVGSGFLPAATVPGEITYDGRLHGLSVPKQVTIDAATTWINISGELPASAGWPENSRIHVTGNITIPANGTLTIGAGTVVRLNPLVNITNHGRTVINGTLEAPVVFTTTNIVVPENNAGAWGGFYLRGTAAQLVANATIMMGGGGAESVSFSPGSSHRSEQAVIFAHSGARVSMTNCSIINTHGQVGNGYRSFFNLERCLFQKAITTGEYDSCTNVFRNCALIEFPEENGRVNAQIADADYDASYFILGTNFFTNTLIGFCKDDAIDAGSGGAGGVRVERGWIESALHEALAWSGSGRKTWTIDTVLMNSGQGIEAGWSSSNPGDGALATPSPDVFAERLLTTANSVGARFGDNYPWGFKGFLRITNSLILNNYRDVFARTWNNPGQSWDTNSWVDRLGQMDLRSNKLTRADARFPGNEVWNPAVDGPRLAHWMTTPPDAAVGVGFAVWTNQFSKSALFAGVPVRLSSFTTNSVLVNYAFETANGTLETGSVTFLAGETVKRIYPTSFDLQSEPTITATLIDAVGGEITGLPEVRFSGNLPAAQVSAAILKAQLDLTRLGEGVPMMLSAPAPSPITVEYEYETAGGTIGSGTLTFAIGQRLAWVQPPDGPNGFNLVRFSLRSPQGATIVGPTNLYFLPNEAASPQPSVTFLPRSAPAWRFLDTGVNAGSAWRNLDYNDSAWGTGAAQLGYGESDQATTVSFGPSSNNKYITTYFRKTFVVTNVSMFADLSMWLLRDDGGLVYLNGTEVFRTPNMPQAPAGIDYLTPANTTGENSIDTATLSAGLLVQGTNIVAVEIHQESPDSSDLSFDFELIGNPFPISTAPPRIYFGTFDGQLVLAWSDASFKIEEADDVTGPWAELTTGSPLVVSPEASQKFYRLKR